METVVAVAVAFIAYVFLKRLLIIDLSVEKAREMFKEGGLVIDVRNENEHDTAHVQEAINIPLPEIKHKIGEVVPDKDKVVLLHCRTGSRSFVGKKILKQMGYKNVYNIGSLRRARKIVGES